MIASRFLANYQEVATGMPKKIGAISSQSGNVTNSFLRRCVPRRELGTEVIADRCVTDIQHRCFFGRHCRLAENPKKVSESDMSVIVDL